ncbi:MAG: pitrilysin family protein [Candidatus Omnitrophica bacterium]|jgi:predicted Zn-dependent peptidase|nr:insulinase family protein [Candidatus Omnitrophota bacterium]MDD5079845.1 pitrilysin family protein [Candidatus Omnitrophota bacterium]
MKEYNRAVLTNGVRVVSRPMPEKKSVALGIWVNVGSRCETPVNSGISHFLEHMVFKGTGKYTCQKIKESIEGVGGSFNGFTSEEVTCYLVKLPAVYLELALDILSEMVVDPIIPRDELERERTVVLEEIKMYKDQPQSYVHELLDKLLWPGHPLGMSILGTKASVTSLSRRDLIEYKKSRYTAANIVVSAAGSLDHDELVEKAVKRFAGLKRSGLNACGKFKGSLKHPQVSLCYKETEQTHLAAGFRGLNKEHPLRYALSLLNVILGGNSSSRLFSEIREKRGLAYEIGSGAKFLKDTGAFIVHAGVDNNKVKDTVELIFRELRRAIREKAGLAELKRAKEFLTGQMLLSLEDTMDQMFWIGEPTVSLDKTYSPEEIIAKVRQVSLEDLQQVCRLLFREDNTHIALIGPVKATESAVSGWARLK